MPSNGFWCTIYPSNGYIPDSFPAARENWRITMLNLRAYGSNTTNYLILFVIVDPKPYILLIFPSDWHKMMWWYVHVWSIHLNLFQIFTKFALTCCWHCVCTNVYCSWKRGQIVEEFRGCLNIIPTAGLFHTHLAAYLAIYKALGSDVLLFHSQYDIKITK